MPTTRWSVLARSSLWVLGLAAGCDRGSHVEAAAAALGGDPTVAGHCVTSNNTRINVGGVGQWRADALQGSGPRYAVNGGDVECAATNGPWITVRRQGDGTAIAIGEGTQRGEGACLEITLDAEHRAVSSSIVVEPQCTSAAMIETLRGATSSLAANRDVPAELAGQSTSLRVLLAALTGQRAAVGAGNRSCLAEWTDFAAPWACSTASEAIDDLLLASRSQNALSEARAHSASCAAATLGLLTCRAANPSGAPNGPPECSRWSSAAQCCDGAACVCASRAATTGPGLAAPRQGECPASLRVGTPAAGACATGEVRAVSDVYRLAPGTHRLNIASNDCKGGSPARITVVGQTRRVAGDDGEDDALEVTCDEGDLQAIAYSLRTPTGGTTSNATVTVFCSACSGCITGGGGWCRTAKECVDEGESCPVPTTGGTAEQPRTSCEYPCTSFDEATSCGATPGCSWCAALSRCAAAGSSCTPESGGWLDR